MYATRDPNELIKAVAEDVQLTHGHPEVIQIACIYSMMLYKAINGADAKSIWEYGAKKTKYSSLFAIIYSAVKQNNNFFIYDNNRYHITDIDGTYMGFVGFAIWLLLISISKYISYPESLLDVVKKGGDTDTNGCIVGAVMGALYPKTIPKKWIDSVINCKSKRHETYPLSDPKIWINFLENPI